MGMLLIFMIRRGGFVHTLWRVFQKNVQTLSANIFQTDYKLKFIQGNIFLCVFLICRYPKPGTRNPVATLRVADLADPKNFRIRDIKPPTLLINE